MDETIGNAQIATDAAIELSKLETEVIRADGAEPFAADQSMGGFKLTNLEDGADPADAVTKSQLDAVAAMASGSGGAHAGVRVATTADIDLASAPAAVDGVTLSASDRVLVKNQTAPEENGIYVFNGAGSAMTRAADGDAWDELVMTPMVPVEEGTANADTLWLVTADRGGTLDTTAVTFVQLPGPSDIVAGDGLTRSGQTINFVTADTSLTVGANNVAVNPGEGLEVSTGVRVKLDGSTLARSGSGLKVAAGGVTDTELNASVAGDGLSGGGGSALSVSTGDGLEINGDAVRVKLDGASIARSGGGIKVDFARFVKRETPTGTVNGTNDTFTFANTPFAGSEEIFVNGILQDEGGGNDYTISGGTFVFNAGSIPLTGDKVRGNYIY